MSNCNQLNEATIKEAIRRQRKEPHDSEDKPGTCIFCRGPVGYAFSIMSDGEAVRVSEGHKHYGLLMERWEEFRKTGKPMAVKPGAIVIPIHACGKAIRLMDDVDRDDRLAAIEREKKKPAANKPAKKQQWYQD